MARLASDLGTPTRGNIFSRRVVCHLTPEERVVQDASGEHAVLWDGADPDDDAVLAAAAAAAASSAAAAAAAASANAAAAAAEAAQAEAVPVEAAAQVGEGGGAARDVAVAAGETQDGLPPSAGTQL